MQAGLGAAEVRQLDGDDLDAQRREDLPKLAEPLGVGAEALAGGQGVAVEPEEVSPLGRGLALERGEGGDADLPQPRPSDSSSPRRSAFPIRSRTAPRSVIRTGSKT